MEGPQIQGVRPGMAETHLPDVNQREKPTTTQPQPQPSNDASSPWHNRSTLCIGSSTPGISLHKGDSTFLPHVSSLFTSPESRAAEKLMLLKQKLPLLDLNSFWTTLMEGLTDILNSQYLFVTKRILVNDHDSAVEMPSIGEPGSCLMAVAFYYNDGKDHAEHVRDFAYEAFGSACAQMKHDKVFVVPSGLYEFVAEENKKNFAFPVDAYIGVPLFAEGKCFAHYGALWTQEALRQSGLSWGYIEMVMHSCEDLIAQRLIKGQSFTKRANKKTHVVIPKAVVSATQSLRPYARSLSHELRTPMQGVVGMLDIMHATVHEALENPPTSEMAGVLRTLRQNIEMVQDSSRRAVEAADNVVHAYELDMQVPGSPVQEEATTNEVENENDNEAENDVEESTQEPEPEPEPSEPQPASPKRPSTSTSTNPQKRRRVSDDTLTQGSPKMRALEHIASGQQTPRTEAVRSALRDVTSSISSPTIATPSRTHFPEPNPQSQLTPSKIRSVLHVAVHECLRFGGRPESAIAEETPLGEVIEVETRRPDGTPLYKRVEWSVSADMPELELASVDERDFAKLVSVLILNSLKFTAEGRIDISVAPSPRGRFLLVTVKDTGSGIPATFRPQLFKPFSREDDTITRSNEGLGLGLLVAKGLARRLGGDLDCIRSETSGPSKGTEFELKIPLMSSEKSGQSTPTGTRTPTPTRRTSGGSLSVANARVTSSPRVGQEGFTGSPEHAHAQLFATTSNSNAKLDLQIPTTAARPPLPTPTIDVFPPTPLPQALPPQLVQSERRESIKNIAYDRYLAKKYPLKFMVAEDNRLNRTLLVTMLSKLGYTDTREAFDGREAVRLMEMERARSAVSSGKPNGIDMILMDLWMPNMDGYEATRQILAMDSDVSGGSASASVKGVKIVAVTADVTDTALDKARAVGMVGSMTKPYRLTDLERLIVNHCTTGETAA